MMASKMIDDAIEEQTQNGLQKKIHGSRAELELLLLQAKKRGMSWHWRINYFSERLIKYLASSFFSLGGGVVVDLPLLA